MPDYIPSSTFWVVSGFLCIMVLAIAHTVKKIQESLTNNTYSINNLYNKISAVERECAEKCAEKCAERNSPKKIKKLKKSAEAEAESESESELP